MPPKKSKKISDETAMVHMNELEQMLRKMADISQRLETQVNNINSPRYGNQQLNMSQTAPVPMGRYQGIVNPILPYFLK